MEIKLTQKAELAVNNSMSAALELGHSYIGSEHMLLGLLSVKDSVAEKYLSGYNIEYSKIEEIITSISDQSGQLYIYVLKRKLKKVIINIIDSKGI